ncbi:MAG: pitrilysin family protein [Bacteroidales bacterium]|nr:pitrilysin family protein [Bacteroidales bacterium]
MKHKLSIFTVLMLVLALGALQASERRIEFTEFTLDNGLHVILHEDNTTPNVVVNIMYHVGAKNEYRDRTGFAHFFEHLMFEGSTNIGRGEFAEIVEMSGGALNAYTSFDVTNYFVLLPSNQLELGLWLESERLLHPVIDSIGIATQKDVVTEEMKQTRDNQPYGRILTETIKRAFTVHPYQSDILGKDEHIRNATDEDIVAFHDMFYVPNNAVLVITGDIDTRKTRRLVERYFGDIPAGTQEIIRPDIVEPMRTQELRDTVYDNIQLPALIQAYHIPAQGAEDYYAVQMLGTLLSQGQSSRLYRRLVVEEQSALVVQAMPLGLEDPGLNLVLAIANMGTDLQTIEASINEELERVRTELISEEEFLKLRNQVESRMVNSNTTIASRAMNLANYHTLFGDASLINTEIDRYMAVTKEDILAAAQKYMREDNRVVIYYLPKPE